MIPGEILTAPGDITLNEGRDPITVMVANTGDRGGREVVQFYVGLPGSSVPSS